MWNTPEGDRRLTGAEAELVRESLAVMVDQLTDNLRCESGEDELWDSGVTMYDELTASQQLKVLKQVAEHLLHETPDTLELTAVNEAAAYAIFATVVSQIEIEIELARDPLAERIEAEPGFRFGSDWRTFWRQRVSDAYRETLGSGQDGIPGQAVVPAYGVAPADRLGVPVDRIRAGDGQPFVLPPVESDDVAVWSEVTERLADRILWDRDFEMSESFLDTDPDKAALMKQVMGIESNYYTAIADEPSEDETAALLEEVRKITRGR